MDGAKIVTIAVDDVDSQSGDMLPTTFVLPISNLKQNIQADNGSMLEEILLLLQNVSKFNDTPRCVCFWTCNAVGPWTVNGPDQNESENESSLLVGGSVLGMVRSAALEVNLT